MTLKTRNSTAFTYREVALDNRLREVAREVAMKPALIHGDRVVTYAELDAASDRLAGALARRGIARGDRVTLFMPNSIEFVIAFYATLKAGGVVNPINAQSKEREVRFQVEDSGAKAVLVHEALWQVVEPIRVELGEDRLLSRTGNAPGVDVTRFDDLVSESAAAPVRREDVFVNVLPYFHIYALNLLMAGAVSLGATQVVMSRFDMVEYLTLIERHKATVCFIVPPIVLGLAAHPEVDRHDLSSVRFFFSGAAPLAPEPARRLVERTHIPIIQGYGLTETSPVTHANPIDAAIIDSIGRTVPGTEHRIVDVEKGTRDLALGEVGEIAVRGPQVMRGYWGKPGDTAAVLRDGWFFTGDVGKVDDKGYVFIVDRKKEFIKYKGFGVGPAEVEAVLCEHPAVADAGVIGKPDEAAGEIPKAFVQLRAGATVTADELMDFVKERIADYKRVREIEFIDKVPRTASGKILRRELAEKEKAATAAR